MPVRITVQTTTVDVEGELVAEWGNAVVTRAVSITAPGRKEFELLIRAAEVTSLVTVRLDSPAATLSADVPVRVATPDERLTVCVTAPAGQPIPETCTTTIAPEALPRSMRGYEAADDVWIGATSRLAPEQRQALDQWRAVRALEDTTRFTAVPELPSVLSRMARRSRVAAPIVWGAAAYVLSLAAVSLLVTWSRLPAVAIVWGTACLIAAGASAALAAGRAGPASAITLQHLSVVQQIAGTGVSLVAMRAVAVFPAAGSFALTADVTDGSLRADRSEASSVETATEDGRPLVTGRYGLGAAQPVWLEAVTALQPFEVTRRGETLHVTPTSAMDLHDCRVAPGSAQERGADLGNGASIEVARPQEAPGALVTCRSTASPVAFTSDGQRVVATGDTTVSVFLAAEAGSARP